MGETQRRTVIDARAWMRYRGMRDRQASMAPKATPKPRASREQSRETVYLEPALRAALKAHAAADCRPVANLLRKIVIEWLRTHPQPTPLEPPVPPRR
jgi:hypothetical protein